MAVQRIGRWLWRTLLRRHGRVKSFEQELERAGGLAGRVDRGVHTVPTEKVVGSVGRWQALRSDFFYRTGRAVTARYRRVGKAMEQGIELPAIDVYKIARPPQAPQDPPPPSEYYVVDGHHRVAMARRFGRAFLDARVVEYSVRDSEGPGDAAGEGKHEDTSSQQEQEGERDAGELDRMDAAGAPEAHEDD